MWAHLRWLPVCQDCVQTKFLADLQMLLSRKGPLSYKVTQHGLASYPGLLTPVFVVLQATNAGVRRPGYKANMDVVHHHMGCTVPEG